MATGNFNNKNASKIFACKIENGFDYEDLIENISNHFENGKKYYFIPSKKWEDNSSRILGELNTESNDFEDLSSKLITNIIIRSGYYDGCNLDFSDIMFTNNYDGIEYDNIEDFIFALTKYHEDFDITQKMANILAKKIKIWYKNEITSIQQYIENIFVQYSETLNIVAHFSNGETIYKKAK